MPKVNNLTYIQLWPFGSLMMGVMDVKNRKLIKSVVFLVMLTEVCRGMNSRGGSSCDWTRQIWIQNLSLLIVPGHSVFSSWEVEAGPVQFSDPSVLMSVTGFRVSTSPPAIYISVQSMSMRRCLRQWFAVINSSLYLSISVRRKIGQAGCNYIVMSY